MKKLLILLSLAAAAALQPARESVAISTGPYLENPAGDSMTVMWVTNRNTTGAVEYGLPGKEWKTATGSHDGLIDANERVHKVVLKGLEPGTVYRYRVVSRDILSFGAEKVDFGETVSSEPREFRTFDPGARQCSFLVFNDLHDVAATLPDMLKVVGGRPYDFVLWNGDSISQVQDERQITAMLDAAVRQFASRVPLIWARGNHETRGAFARQLPRYLDSPGGRFYYSFDHGPVHFVVLDAGEDKPDNHPEYSGLVDFAGYRREEARWLADEVDNAAFRLARYRVVFVHIPSPNAIPEEAGVDLMISGHVHTPAILAPEAGRTYPIVRGGGPLDKGRTVICVDVNEKTLEAAILRPDGTAFGVCRVPARPLP